jgi:hypothetical protein
MSPGERREEVILGISIVMLALGAVLIWGTSATVSGLDLGVVGIVLTALSVVGVFAALALWEPRRGRLPDRRANLDRQRSREVAPGE